MSDTILRKAHMSAITEIAELTEQIRRLKTGMLVAECINQYLAARMQLHGRPTKADTAILSLGQLAMDAKTNEDMEMAVDSLRALFALTKQFTTEAIAEAREESDLDSVTDDVTVDTIIRGVLARVDEKLVAHQKELIAGAGFSEEELDQLRREIQDRFGTGQDSE